MTREPGQDVGTRRAARRAAAARAGSSARSCAPRTRATAGRSARSAAGRGGGRITSACRVVSLRYGSTLTMKSSPANAPSSRSPFGADSTGLPAIVMSARTWPSPGVSISSARVATGSSPLTSGRPRTRLCHRPVRIRPPARGRRARGRGEREHRAAGPVEVAGQHVERRRPASWSSVPYSWVQVPMRPYTAARRRGGELPRQPRIRSGRHAVRPRHRLGREGPRRARAARRGRSRRGRTPQQVLGEQRVHEPKSR